MAIEKRPSLKYIIGAVGAAAMFTFGLSRIAFQDPQPDTSQNQPTPIMSPAIPQFISENPVCCLIPITGTGIITMYFLKNRKYLKGRDL